MKKEGSMTERVLAQLRDELVNWKYNVNDLITEAEISEQFHVSKTPAREALNCLCMEGLLEKLPHKGYLVRGVSVTELQQLFQFRSILENASVELAIRYASDEETALLRRVAEQRVEQPMGSDAFQQYSELNYRFHMTVASLSRNPHLISALRKTLNQLRRALILDWKSADVNRLLEAHTVMADAIIARDVPAAQKCVMRECDFAESRIYAREAGLQSHIL